MSIGIMYFYGLPPLKSGIRAPVIRATSTGSGPGDVEERALDKILTEQLLEHLTGKERETIILWSHGNSLKEIALEISVKYDGRTPDNPLSGRAMGVRIRKIINKLQLVAKDL
jgi:hypothetical protein